MKHTRTVVTGATGFLGRRLCAALVARAEPVLALGRRFDTFPPWDASQCARQVCDLDDRDGLVRAFTGATAVIHVAALSAPWAPRAAFLRANVDGTRHVLEAARRARVARVVHVSSSSVAFGDRDGCNLREDEPRPRAYLSDYCDTKAMAEDVVHAFPDVPSVILRPRGIFGPGDTTILPRILARARSGKLRIPGDGRNVADITYVDNVVDALLLARDAKAAVGNTYFISNGDPVVLWDFIGACLEGVGVARPTRTVPYAVAFRAAQLLERLHRAIPSLGEPVLTPYTVSILAQNQTVSLDAARRDLGYHPRISMSDALSRTIDAFRTEPTP